jgi:hypothetical protein
MRRFLTKLRSSVQVRAGAREAYKKYFVTHHQELNTHVVKKRDSVAFWHQPSI